MGSENVKNSLTQLTVNAKFTKIKIQRSIHIINDKILFNL